MKTRDFIFFILPSPSLRGTCCLFIGRWSEIFVAKGLKPSYLCAACVSRSAPMTGCRLQPGPGVAAITKFQDGLRWAGAASARLSRISDSPWLPAPTWQTTAWLQYKVQPAITNNPPPPRPVQCGGGESELHSTQHIQNATQSPHNVLHNRANMVTSYLCWHHFATEMSWRLTSCHQSHGSLCSRVFCWISARVLASALSL